MPDQDVPALKQAVQNRWPQSQADSPKVKRYVGKFWDRQRRERKITAVVRVIVSVANSISCTCIREDEEVGETAVS